MRSASCWCAKPDRLELDDFFVRFLAGVERTLAEREYALVLHLISPDARDDLDAHQLLIASARVDGVLLTDVVLDDPRFELFAGSGLPTVVAGSPWGDCPLPVVETQHARGMAELIEYLLSIGHRSVSFIAGDPAYAHVAARRWAWIDTMRRAGPDPGLSASVVPEDAAAPQPRAAAELAPSDRTLYTTDALALAGLGVARQRGLSVPGDVSSAGFDDSPLASLSTPPPTTVRIDYAEFGGGSDGRAAGRDRRRPPPPLHPCGASADRAPIDRYQISG